MKHQIRNMMLRAARPYVAGPRLEDALRMAEFARTRGCSVTLCYWHDENDPADAVADAYSATIRAVSRAGLNAHLAMKVPGLRDEASLIRSVMAEARAHGVPVDIDAHGPDQAEAAFAAAGIMGPDGLGMAIPGRWKSSVKLADRAVAAGLRVRVVKGSWVDPAAPRLDPAGGYLSVIDRLAGRCREVGVATHDPVLAGEAIRRLTAAGTPVEQELLYGLPMAAPFAVGRQAGVKTRVYIPYGDAWVPYSLRRAIRNPRTIVRLVTDLATGDRDGLPRPA
jgi:proline dehydrogenase